MDEDTYGLMGSIADELAEVKNQLVVMNSYLSDIVDAIKGR